MRVTRCDPPFASYNQLIDGTYTIDDVADMHEVLDVIEENQRRYNEANEKNKA